eukprot:3472378-Pyramimonas_sp.AAC.1
MILGGPSLLGPVQAVAVTLDASLAGLPLRIADLLHASEHLLRTFCSLPSCVCACRSVGSKASRRRTSRHPSSSCHLVADLVSLAALAT